jgi:hypothetical protein
MEMKKLCVERNCSLMRNVVNMSVKAFASAGWGEDALQWLDWMINVSFDKLPSLLMRGWLFESYLDMDSASQDYESVVRLKPKHKKAMAGIERIRSFREDETFLEAYEVLGVHSNASFQEIERAWRDLQKKAKEKHGIERLDKKRANWKTCRINRAFDCLKTEEQRFLFDNYTHPQCQRRPTGQRAVWTPNWTFPNLTHKRFDDPFKNRSRSSFPRLSTTSSKAPSVIPPRIPSFIPSVSFSFSLRRIRSKSPSPALVPTPSASPTFLQYNLLQGNLHEYDLIQLIYLFLQAICQSVYIFLRDICQFVYLFLPAICQSVYCLLRDICQSVYLFLPAI